MAKLTTWLTLLLAAKVHAQGLVTVSVCLSYSVTEVVTVTSFEGAAPTPATTASGASNVANPTVQAPTAGFSTVDSPSSAASAAVNSASRQAAGTPVGDSSARTAVGTSATVTAAAAATASTQNGLAAPAVIVDPEVLQDSFYITFASPASENPLDKRQLAVIQYLGFANYLSVLYPSPVLAALMWMGAFGLQSGNMFVAMDGMRFVLQVIPPIVPVMIVMVPGGGMMIPGTQGFCMMGNQLNVVPNYGAAPGGCQAVSPGLEAAPSIRTTTTMTTTTTKKTSTTTRKTTTTTKTTLKTTTTQKSSSTTTQRPTSKISSAKQAQTTAVAVQTFTPVDTCRNYPAPIPSCDDIHYITGSRADNYIDWSPYFSGYGVSGTATDGSANANHFTIPGSVNLCDAFYQCIQQFESRWLSFALYKVKPTGNYLCMWGQAVYDSWGGGNNALAFTMVNSQVEQAYGWVGCKTQTCQPKYCNTFFTPGSILPSPQIAASTSRSTSNVKNTSSSTTKKSSSSTVATFMSTFATTTLVKPTSSTTPGLDCDYNSDAGCSPGPCGSCFLPWGNTGWQYGSSYCVSSFGCYRCNTDRDCTDLYGASYTCGYHRNCNFQSGYSGNSCGRALSGVCPYSPLLLPATSKASTTISSSTKSVISSAAKVMTSPTSTGTPGLSCDYGNDAGCAPGSCGSCFLPWGNTGWQTSYCVSSFGCYRCNTDTDCTSLYGAGYTCGYHRNCNDWQSGFAGTSCGRALPGVCPYSPLLLPASSKTSTATVSSVKSTVSTRTITTFSATSATSTSSAATSTQPLWFGCVLGNEYGCSSPCDKCFAAKVGYDYPAQYCISESYCHTCTSDADCAVYGPEFACGITTACGVNQPYWEPGTACARSNQAVCPYNAYQLAVNARASSTSKQSTLIGTSTVSFDARLASISTGSRQSSTAVGVSPTPSLTRVSCINSIPQDCISLADTIFSMNDQSVEHQRLRNECNFHYWQQTSDVLERDIYLAGWYQCLDLLLVNGTPGSAVVACLQRTVMCASANVSKQSTLGATAFTYDGRFNPTTTALSSSTAGSKASCVNALPQDCTDMAIDGWASMLPSQASAMQLCQDALTALTPFVAEMSLTAAWSCTSPPPGTPKSEILRCLRDFIVCGPTSTTVQAITTGRIMPTFDPYSSQAMTAYSSSPQDQQGPCLSTLPQGCTDISFETYFKDLQMHQYAMQGCRNAVLALKSFLGDAAFFRSWACAFPENGTPRATVLKCLESAMVCSLINATSPPTIFGSSLDMQTTRATTTTQSSTTSTPRPSPCIDAPPMACASVYGIDGNNVNAYRGILQQCQDALTPLLTDSRLLKAWDCLSPAHGTPGSEIYACVKSAAVCGFTRSTSQLASTASPTSHVFDPLLITRSSSVTPTTTTRLPRTICLPGIPLACGPIASFPALDYDDDYQWTTISQCRAALTPQLVHAQLFLAWRCLDAEVGTPGTVLAECVRGMVECGLQGSTTSTNVGMTTSESLGTSTWMTTTTTTMWEFSSFAQSTTAGNSSAFATVSGPSDLIGAGTLGTLTTLGSENVESGPSSSSSPSAADLPQSTRATEASTASSPESSSADALSTRTSTTIAPSSSIEEPSLPSSSLTTMAPLESPRPVAETTVAGDVATTSGTGPETG